MHDTDDGGSRSRAQVITFREDLEGGMGDTELITLAGDIDLNQVEALRALHAAFQRSTAPNVIVDMSDVTFFGSEGCGLIARLHRVAQQRGGGLTLVNASPAALRVVEICGLRDVIYVERRFPAAPAGG